MALTRPRRHSFVPDCSSDQEELDRLSSTLDTVPSSQAYAIQTPLKLSLVEMWDLWTTTNKHVSKSDDGEARLDSEAVGKRLQSAQSPATHHPGWLFKELLSTQDQDPGGYNLPISTDFSQSRGQLAVGKTSWQQSRKSQRVVRANHTEIALRNRQAKDTAPRTRHSQHFFKAADDSAHLHQWTSVKTEFADDTTSDTSPSVQKSPTVHYGKEECTNTFVFSGALAQIFPFDSLALLEQDTRHCISTKSRTLVRCRKNAKSVMSAAVFAREVAEISQETCMMRQLDMLESLSRKMLCGGGHHHERACRNLQSLRAHMSSQHSGHASCGAHAGLCSVSIAAFPYWLQALSSYTHTRQQESLRVTEQPVSPTKTNHPKKQPTEQVSSVLLITRSSETSTVSSRTQSSAVVKVVATSSTHADRVPSPVSLHCWPQKFQHWRPNPSLTVPQLIRQTIEKPVGEKSQKPGYVYIYWNPGNFGYVKIGFTASTVEKRLSQWKQGKCNHGVEEYTGAISSQSVPHVFRVESLVFAELRDFRLKELNCACTAEHQEWFRVTPMHVAKVRQKWENFMLEQERYGSGRCGQFLRGTISRDELDKLCQPLELEKTQSPDTEKALRTGRLRRSSRLGRALGGNA